jgi:anaerobic magnesium-protoporphyrin IX monomethyl ester cyclase
LKLLLINPPHNIREIKPLGEVNLPIIPLGLGYIAAMLKLHGLSSKVLDMNVLEMRLNELKKYAAKYEPNIVGITSMTSNYSSAINVVKAIKSWFPKTYVVMGGVHATFMFEEILRTVPQVDAVVRYEGEFTMSELSEKVQNDEDLASVKGIAYRDHDKVVSTPPRERIENLDDLPYPAYDLYEPTMEQYLQEYKVQGFPVMTTRGCPFECIYCSTAALHGHKYRTRSVTNVVDEVEYLMSKYKVGGVSFVDDNFTMQNDRVRKLCQEIKKRHLSLKWGCSTRTDMVTPSLMEEMKSAGCDNIFFGIESLSDPVLKIIKKGPNATAKNAINTVKQAEGLGIRTHCSFILGLPGETPQTMNRIVDFVDEAKPSGRVIPNELAILPGTEIYQKKHEYFSNHPTVSKADITETQIRVILEFYKLNVNFKKAFKVIPPNIVLE